MTTTQRPTGRWLLRRAADAALWTLIAMGSGMSGLGGMVIMPPAWPQDGADGRVRSDDDEDGR